jgi:hypothetical protein
MNIIERLFYQNAYAVGIRKIDPEDDIINPEMGKYTMLMPTDNEWYADSFCYVEQGQVYLFMEIMGRNGDKGTLGVSKYMPGVGFSEVKEILREAFHLSYPNVFKYKSTYYMIPETNESKQLRIYESNEFPTKWTLRQILYEGKNLVDTSFLKIDDEKLLLFSHDITDGKAELLLFELDLEALTLKELPKSNNLSDERPGGNIITVNGKFYRVLQDCSVNYGEKLKIYQFLIGNKSADSYSEKLIGEVNADMIHTDQHVKFIRIHTLTRSECYEGIDMLYKRFYISRPLKGIKRIVNRKLEEIKWK